MRRQRALERVYGPLVAAVAHEELLLRRRRESCAMIGDRLFDRACAEEHPAIVVSALGGRRGQPCVREGLSQTGDDRAGFGDDAAIVHKGGYYADQIDLREKAWRPTS